MTHTRGAFVADGVDIFRDSDGLECLGKMRSRNNDAAPRASCLCILCRLKCETWERDDQTTQCRLANQHLTIVESMARVEVVYSIGNMYGLRVVQQILWPYVRSTQIDILPIGVRCVPQEERRARRSGPKLT